MTEYPLVCPLCRGELTRDAGRVSCQVGHSFDRSRFGYLSLVTGDARISGDTADMVRARADLLDTGLYEPIAEALVDTVDAIAPDVSSTQAGGQWLADLGGGTGYYSSFIMRHTLSPLNCVLLDVSKHAARVAAKTGKTVARNPEPRWRVATADLRHSIPLADDSIGVALVIFAPRNPAEIARILTPGGACIVVTPTQANLRELRECVPMVSIDTAKEDRLTSKFASFHATQPQEVTYARPFTREQAMNAVAMGPSAFHLDAAAWDTIRDTLPATIDVTVSVAIHVFTNPD